MDAAEGGISQREFQQKVLDGVEGLQKSIQQHEEALKGNGNDIAKLKELGNDVTQKLGEFRKAQLAMKSAGVRRPGHVTEECARHLGGIAVLAGLRGGQLKGDRYEGLVKDVLGMEARTALTSSDIPLPESYGSEVVELVSQYGAARQFGIVYPLGSGTTKLPRLKTSPAFGLIAGSGAVTEVSPQTEWVTFTPEKFGGLVRLPTEIDEDSIFAVGQFVARYAAREMAKVEDTQFFLSTGAGSGVNGSVKGLCVSTINNSKVVQLGSTKTKYSDATLANIRAIRAVVDSAALGMGSYFMHPSFEQHLAGLNTSGDKPYQANGVRGATLDGFPINWVDIMPAYSTSANASKVFMLFGDLSYQYLGIRRGLQFDVSREAGFTTDEILVRALERLTVGLMATGAVAGLETAES